MLRPVPTKTFLQFWLGSIVIAGILAIFATINQADKLEIIFWRSRWVLIVGVFLIISLMSAGLIFSPLLKRISQKIDSLEKEPPRTSLGVGLILFGFFLTWAFRLYIFGNTLPQVAPIFWIFLWASLLQVLGIKLIKPSTQWHIGFVIVLLTQGFIYQTLGIFRIVSADPFSIGYSEAGRFYYASLFSSKSLYRIELPLPFLHPSRYILLSIPFLFDGLPLWAHRLWQTFLWFGLTLTASFLISKRLKLDKGITIFVTVWLYLFFLQGAVYYHLQICVILIFIGVSVKSFWRSLIFIALASIWAGISRVNWFPVPAMLAITIYILETPINNKGWKYWLVPFVWGITGIIFAFLAQFIYISISGNANVSSFGSSFTSDLIWSRLLPNETYPMGILLGITLVSLPVWFGIYQILRGNLNQIHSLRWLALLTMGLILFIGGAIVSTKIGGGGDLHNMDAYMVLLAVWITACLANQVALENEAKPTWGKVHWSAVYFALLIPLWFAIPKIGFFHRYNQTATEKDIQKIQEIISVAAQNGGEILFITERQLITFDYVNGVTLISEYEQSELMEMAMSRNQIYLEQYYADLYNRRFALIIAETQKFSPQKQGAFVEEDVAWVQYVGAPLLCNYKPFFTLISNNLEIFEPRLNQVECKDPFVE